LNPFAANRSRDDEERDLYSSVLTDGVGGLFQTTPGNEQVVFGSFSLALLDLHGTFDAPAYCSSA
jgi:hypothetical protein